DGIRDFHVTGVQTCALPISPLASSTKDGPARDQCFGSALLSPESRRWMTSGSISAVSSAGCSGGALRFGDRRGSGTEVADTPPRSEERGGGKDGRPRSAARD